tara:strand:- start:6047 stop:6223 length:177 start_codon:yes stop_codon:yes gene_type:complete
MTFHERKLIRILKRLEECYPTSEGERKRVSWYRGELKDAKEICIWNIGSDAINKLDLK